MFPFIFLLVGKVIVCNIENKTQPSFKQPVKVFIKQIKVEKGWQFSTLVVSMRQSLKLKYMFRCCIYSDDAYIHMLCVMICVYLPAVTPLT